MMLDDNRQWPTREEVLEAKEKLAGAAVVLAVRNAEHVAADDEHLRLYRNYIALRDGYLSGVRETL